MDIRLIRNATLRITYAGKLILVDPYLAEKHALDPIGGVSRNPTVDLPCTPEEAIEGAELVIVSHLHKDHFDQKARDMLDKTLPLYCLPEQAEDIRGDGFTGVVPLEDSVTWEGITLTRTLGDHASKPKWSERLNPVMGFVLEAEGEPTVYWIGDSVYYDEVEKVITSVNPDVIITHSCGAEIGDSGPIVMDVEQTIKVCERAPSATVIAVHMESLDHAKVSRADLRAGASDAGIGEERLLIPANGETISIGMQN